MRLERGTTRLYLGGQRVPGGGRVEELPVSGVEGELRLLDDRAECGVRLRKLVPNLIEDWHRVRSPKGEVGLLHPADDIGSSLKVSPVEHVVPVLLGEEVLDFDGSSVGSPGPRDGEIFSDSRQHSLPIAEELVVHDDRTGATARMLLGFERVS